MPFARRESENRTLGVLAVANTDLVMRQARHLYAVPVGETQGALGPVRICTGLFQVPPGCKCCHVLTPPLSVV
jgi:hypothetical protein